jgi:hypothetical protein
MVLIKGIWQPLTFLLLQMGLDIETPALCIAVLLLAQTGFNLAFCF